MIRDDGSYAYTWTPLDTIQRADTVQLQVVRRKAEAERLSTLSDGLEGSLPRLATSVFARALVDELGGLGLFVSPVANTLSLDGSPYFMVALLNMGVPTSIQNGNSNWHLGDAGTVVRESEEAIKRSEQLKDWLLLPHRSFFGQLVSARCPVLPNREGVTQQCSAGPLEPGEYAIPVQYQRTIYDEAGRPSSVDLRDTVRYVVRR